MYMAMPGLYRYDAVPCGYGGALCVPEVRLYIRGGPIHGWDAAMYVRGGTFVVRAKTGAERADAWISWTPIS